LWSFKLTKEFSVKKLVKVEEVADEGFLALMGQCVTIFSLNYIYAGTLVGVNDKFVKLENAHIVYETGPFTDKKFKDAQKVSDELYVQLATVESYFVGKQL
jgi:hypothetical protein